MPLHLDDLRFIDEAVREAFRGALDLFAAPHGGDLILSGCAMSHDPNAPSVAVTQGFALLGGEICFVPAHAEGGDPQDLSLQIFESIDPAGNDVFADGIARDTYQIRRARLAPTAAAGPQIAAENIGAQSLEKRLRAITEPASTAVALTSSDFLNDWQSLSGNIAIARKRLGEVRLSGWITAGTLGTEAFILPIGFRPVQELQFVVACNLGGHELQVAKVSPNGTVALITDSGTALNSPRAVCLANISFQAA